MIPYHGTHVLGGLRLVVRERGRAHHGGALLQHDGERRRVLRPVPVQVEGLGHVQLLFCFDFVLLNKMNNSTIDRTEYE